MNVRALAAATFAVLTLGLTGDALLGVTAGGLDGLLPQATADVRRTGAATGPTGPAAPDDRRGRDLQAALTAVGDPAASPASAAVHDHSSHDHSATGQPPAVPAPTHADPPPPGVDLDAPTDTRSLYERAGLPLPRKAAAGSGQQGTDTVPPGNPVLPGLTEHVEPSCTGTGTDGKRVQVIYAYTAGGTSRYAQQLALLRNEVATVDDVFALSSDKTGGGRRVRWVHDGSCQPVIDEVALPASALGNDFGATITALQNAGYTRSDRKYVVFADVNKLCGIASFYTDTRPVPTNHNNGAAATYARIDVNCWVTSPTSKVSTAAHELLHSLGGVFASAPNATANGHCDDEYDVMCYVDGPGVTMNYVCPSSHGGLLDCNDDDYFTTAPVPGTFLAQNWNTAGSSFLDTVQALSAGPPVDVVASATAAQTGDTVTFTASSTDPVTYAWSYPHADCVSGPTDQATLTVRCPSTRTGTHTATVTATAGDGSTEVSRQLTVTKAAAPTLALDGAGSVRAGRDLPLTATGGGKPALAYAWAAPAGCTLDGTTTAAVVAVCDETTVGSARTFTATVTQADGQTTSKSHTVEVDGAPAVAVTGRPLVQVGGTTTLTAEVTYPSAAPTYAWTSANGWISGASDAATVTIAVPADAGPGEDTLTVTVTTALGEQATAQVTVSATAEPVRVPTRLSASATPGTRTVLRATLTDVLGPVLAGERVVLQRRWAGTTRWRTELTRTTDAAGAVRAKVRPGRVAYYRWVHQATAGTAKSVSRQLRVRR